MHAFILTFFKMLQLLVWNAEAAAGVVRLKNVFLKILLNSQENTLARISLKKRL